MVGRVSERGRRVEVKFETLRIAARWSVVEARLVVK